jgi:hypothetical protein
MAQEMQWNTNTHKLEVLLTAQQILHFMLMQNDRDMIEIIWEYLERNKYAMDVIKQQYARVEADK